MKEEKTGGLLELVDLLCNVTATMAEIIRRQTILIEHEKIMETVLSDDLLIKKEQMQEELDLIEKKMGGEKWM